MNFDTIPHPELFFIEDVNLLRDPQNKFVENLQNYLSVVQDLKVNFRKTELLESSLFSKLPWSKLYEKYLSKQDLVNLSGQLYLIFKKYGETVSTSNLEPSDSIPELVFFDEDILRETKKLITFSKKNKKTFFISNGESNYNFSHKGREIKLKSLRPESLYQEIESFEDWFPKSRIDFKNDIKNCINIYMKKSGTKEIENRTYNFSREFIQDFIDAEKRFKNSIVETIGQRISIDEREAVVTLGDEFINTTKLRRMRVSGQFRIMYNYIDNNKNNFLFISFDTQHDKSLKKRN